MSVTQFTQIPHTSRIWIFAANRELSPAESDMLIAETVAFLQGWSAHKVETLASVELRYNRFLIVAADEEVAKPGGCSIDEMMRRVRMLGETYGIEFIGLPRVEYRDLDGNIQSIPRVEFQKLVENKKVNGSTTVFDNTITSLSDLNGGRWELPARDSWHSRAFDLV